MTNSTNYAARLEIDYPEQLDRLTTFFRLFWIMPIAIILGLLSGAGETVTNTIVLNEAGEVVQRTRETIGGLATGAGIALPVPAHHHSGLRGAWRGFWAHVVGCHH